jgi:hypothetical protein
MASTGLPPRPANSKRTTWVFNPPPGWPVPPAEWQPSADWRPNPSWPPAPAGWEFWKPTRNRTVSFYIKAVAGVLTFAATITGTYLAFRSQPQSPTTASWVQQANAACDRDIGPLQVSLYDGLVSPTASRNDASFQRDFASKVRDLSAAEGSLSKQVGDLSALQTPKDARAPEVQAVLTTGTALVDRVGAFSSVVQAAAEHTPIAPTPQQITQLGHADRHFLTALLAWQKAIGALSLTRCPFWVRHPDATPSPQQQIVPPTPVPSPTSSLTAGEQQLVNLLNPDDLTGCTGRPDQESNGVIAAVNCAAVGAGPTIRPLVVRFSDTSSAQAWFANNTAGIVDRGDCSGGDRLGTWTYNSIPTGTLGCTYTANGSFRMVWTIDGSLVGVIADGSNGETMYNWWTKWCYVVSSSG